MKKEKVKIIIWKNVRISPVAKNELSFYCRRGNDAMLCIHPSPFFAPPGIAVVGVAASSRRCCHASFV